MKQWISRLFYLSALYDGILGGVFLFFPASIFQWQGITPPNHIGYVQFPAALLLVFAIMFFNIARDPVHNRSLIPYGILLKISYCGVTLWHWVFGGIPAMWKPFVVFDAVFAVLFIWAFVTLGRERR